VRADPVLAAAARRSAPVPRPAAVPAQLPRDVGGFAGRGQQLAWLDGLLTAGAPEVPAAVVISAVSRTAGVGKTALAVHWGLMNRFAGVNADGLKRSVRQTAAALAS
jgi:hypothetical protein